MDVQDAVKTYTAKAESFYGDGRTAEFFERLKRREFATLKCGACGNVMFPPRPFCPQCHSDAVFWIEMPRTGTLYGFTTQEKAFRFSNPAVLGLVELEGIGRIITKIDAPFETLRIGMRVELEFLELEDGSVVHQFKPVDAPAK